MLTATWNNHIETVNGKNEIVKADAEKAAILRKVFAGIGKWYSETGEEITKPEMWEMDEAGKKFYHKVDASTIYENN